MRSRNSAKGLTGAAAAGAVETPSTPSMPNLLSRVGLVLGLLLTACGSAEERAETVGGGATPTPQPAACTDGQERECRIIVAVREGYSDCVVGSQVCVASAWSACTMKTEKVISDAGASETEPATDAASD